MATVDQISDDMLLARSFRTWRRALADDCCVYQLENGGFLAKRINQIAYSACDKSTAQDLLELNVRTLLFNKYFANITDEVESRINEVVKNCLTNITDMLKTVTYDRRNAQLNPKLTLIRALPDGCIAFNNGVFDFRKNDWFFKYDRSVADNGLSIVSYDLDYIIRYYINIAFEPLPLTFENFQTTEAFLEACKAVDNVSPNLCFRLVYNMSFDDLNKFSLDKFEHLCEILGYTCLNSFSQYFVIMFGSGQNGKNSLFDGCFSHAVIPTPVANDIDSIEEDRYITGSLETACHNIYLESEAKTYKCSKNLKMLTGSEVQTIEHKFVGKYPGIINCKYIFAGNERDDIKFGDTSNGFLRRVNIITIPYTYDTRKDFLKRGDYYDTTFSDDLRELKQDFLCTEMFIYLAMYGTVLGTNNYQHSFRFTHNEWEQQYLEIDDTLKQKLENIDVMLDIIEPACKSPEAMLDFETVFYNDSRQRFYKGWFDPDVFGLKEPMHDYYAYVSQDEAMITFSSARQFLKATCNEDVMWDDESGHHEEQIEHRMAADALQSEKLLYISAEFLQKKLNYMSMRAFAKAVKKIYGEGCAVRLINNKLFFRCNFKNRGKLSIIR